MAIQWFPDRWSNEGARQHDTHTTTTLNDLRHFYWHHCDSYIPPFRSTSASSAGLRHRIKLYHFLCVLLGFSDGVGCTVSSVSRPLAFSSEQTSHTSPQLDQHPVYMHYACDFNLELLGMRILLLCDRAPNLTMIRKKATRNDTFLHLFPKEEFGVGSEYIFWPKVLSSTIKTCGGSLSNKRGWLPGGAKDFRYTMITCIARCSVGIGHSR
jgi:hypothetical protein